MIFSFSTPAFAQEEPSSSKEVPAYLDLGEEKLDIEANLPSVDLILSFREFQDKNQDRAISFIDEAVNAAKREPF